MPLGARSQAGHSICSRGPGSRESCLQLLLWFCLLARRAWSSEHHLSFPRRKKEACRHTLPSWSIASSAILSRQPLGLLALLSHPTCHSRRPGSTPAVPGSSQFDSTSAFKRSYRRRWRSINHRYVPSLPSWRTMGEYRENKFQAARFVVTSWPDGRRSPEMPLRRSRRSQSCSLMCMAPPSPCTRH